jgi:hypothetical protein
VTKLVKCQHCRQPFERPKGQPGRPARFCKRSCRQRAFERRQVRRRTGLGRQPVRGTPTNDRVMTPLPLARALVDALQPSGRLLEPAAGDGAFVEAMQPYGDVQWCEIDRGRDFFEYQGRVDWLISNPPWSLFRQFLQHAMTVADNVAFLVTVNHWWTNHRRQLLADHGFAIRRVIECRAPKSWKAPGFALAMVHIQRGYQGPTIIETLSTGDHDGRPHPRRPESPSRPIAAPLAPSATLAHTHTPPAALAPS